MSEVAIVTGGSMGLGLEVADRFRDTMTVVTCARDGDVTFHCDVAEPDQVAVLVNCVVGIYGHIDVLVCNAAVYGPVAELDETDWAAWEYALRVDLFGTVLPVRAVLPIMRHQGHGKIITLSGGGVKPNPFCTAYNTAKGGVLRFTEALAVDLAGSGIDVNAVAPGTLDTRMRLRAKMPDDPAAAMKKAVDCIAWLASPASDGITGRTFSAVWDDYEHMPALEPDDFKMRRYVPEWSR